MLTRLEPSERVERTETGTAGRKRHHRRWYALGILVVVAVVATWLSLRPSGTKDGDSGPGNTNAAPASDRWTTVTEDGMSISLPASFALYTDPGDVTDEFSEVGARRAGPFGTEIGGDLFVLAGTYSVEGSEFGAEFIVTSIPVWGTSAREAADSQKARLEQRGATVVGDTETTVGDDRYPAVRVDFEFAGPAAAQVRGVSYVVGGELWIWMANFTTPAEHYEQFAPIVDRSIASLTLPTSGGEVEGPSSFSVSTEADR